MLVFHVWFNAPMPEVYKKYLASLDRFVPQHNVTHVLYSENNEYIAGLQDLCPNLEIRPLDPYLNFANSAMKYGLMEQYKLKYLPISDLMRYKISMDLAKTEDYTYCLDVDIFYLRDPFVDVLIPRSVPIFFQDAPEYWGDLSACNGIYGIPRNCKAIRDILDLGFKFLTHSVYKSRGFSTFGPYLMSCYLRSIPSDTSNYILETDTSIFFSANCFACYDIFKAENESDLVSKIHHVIHLVKSTPNAIGFHLYKLRHIHVDLVNQVGIAIMEGLNKSGNDS